MTPYQIVYRIYCLRRLFVLVTLFPLAMVVALTALDIPFLHLIAWFAVQATCLHVLVYPRATTESVVVSITLAIAILPSWPIATGVWWIAPHWYAFCYFFGVIFLYLGLLWLSSFVTMAGPRPEHRQRTRRFSTASPQALRKVLKYYPGRQLQRSLCGEVDEDGSIPVFTDTAMPDCESPEAVCDNSYRVLILDEGPDHQVVTSVSDHVEGQTTSKIRIVPAAGGAWVELEEQTNMLTWAMRFETWVCDHYADYLMAMTDEAEGRAPRALYSQPWVQFCVHLSYLLPNNDSPKPS